MMNKIFTIAWKDIRSTYSDRNLVMIMLAAPLAVATIIALAFGGLGGGDVPIRDIPVAIVNFDTGANGQNLGATYVNAFIPSEDTTGDADTTCPLVEGTAGNGNSTSLQDLTEAVLLDDAKAAREGVNNGTYAAAIIIPQDFSQKATIGPTKFTVEPTSIEVYANGGRVIQAGIIRSIVEGISNQMATGNVTIQSLLNEVNSEFGVLQMSLLTSSAAFNDNIGCAFVPGVSGLGIDQQSLAGKSVNGAIPLLIVFGAGQAMFFTLFTGQGGVSGIFEERKQWTLQRLVVSPTPRLHILLGKMLGVLVNCVLQLVFLFVALTVVGSVLNGGFVNIWGDNFVLIGLVILSAALSATGVGTLLAGVAKTPEQGQIYGSLVNVAMAVLGGAFGFQLPEAVSRFSLLYWGSDAFQKLANGSTEIGLNLAVLFGLGVVLFGIGFWLFNRRLDV